MSDIVDQTITCLRERIAAQEQEPTFTHVYCTATTALPPQQCSHGSWLSIAPRFPMRTISLPPTLCQLLYSSSPIPGHSCLSFFCATGCGIWIASVYHLVAISPTLSVVTVAFGLRPDASKCMWCAMCCELDLTSLGMQMVCSANAQWAWGGLDFETDTS